MVYLGGNPPKTQDEGKAHFEKYSAWLSELGDALVSPANPVTKSHTISPDGRVEEGSGVQMSGFSILEADSIDAAVKMATGCPFLEVGGTLEVSELAPMPTDA